MEVREVRNYKSTDDEENYDEKDDGTAKKQIASLSVEQINIEGCEDTQVGSRSVYHGEVDVRHVLEIKACQRSTDPSSVDLPYSAGIPALDQICSDDFRNQRKKKDSLPRRLQSCSGSFSAECTCENAPLIEKEKKEETCECEDKPSGLRWEYWIALILIILAVLLAALIIILSLRRSKDESGLPANFTHIYHDRNKWHAQPPKYYTPTFDYIPPKFVVVSQTGTPPCNTSKSCGNAVRNIQSSQLVDIYNDIVYNFLIGGDGLIYEGRGWYTKSAAVPGMGCSSLAVAFIGTFSTACAPPRQIRAFQTFLDTAANNGKLVQDYKLFMHSDVFPGSENPGSKLSECISRLAHWAPFTSEYFLCKDDDNH